MKTLIGIVFISAVICSFYTGFKPENISDQNKKIIILQNKIVEQLKLQTQLLNAIHQDSLLEQD